MVLRACHTGVRIRRCLVGDNDMCRRRPCSKHRMRRSAGHIRAGRSAVGCRERRRKAFRPVGLLAQAWPEEETQVGDLISLRAGLRTIDQSRSLPTSNTRARATPLRSAAKKTTQPCNQPAASPQVFYPRALAEILQRIEKQRIYCNKLVFCLTYRYGD